MANTNIYPYGQGNPLPSEISLYDPDTLFYEASINNAGVPISSTTRIITKVLSGNFRIDFKDAAYKVWAIALYDSAGNYQSVETVSYTGLSYERKVSPVVRYRLVLAKANGTDTVSLADEPVTHLFVGYGKDTLVDSLQLEQGSISTSSWNRSSQRVCNARPMLGGFSIAVNSGYIIRYGVYEDEDGVFHELISQSTTRTTASYSHTGNIKCYLTFCKTDTNADVAPTEDIIKYVFYQGEGPKFALDAGGYMDFTVEVDTNVANVDDDTLALQDAQVFENDCGRIYLPKTYKEEGKPTRLIVHCHGASQNYNNGAVFPKNSSLVTVDYLLAKGYAVMDVNGLPGTNSFPATTCGNPIAYRSYLAAYKWAVKNCNIYKEIFVVGISAGSIPALQISQIETVPVLACVTYCGLMDFSRGWMLLGGYHGNNTQGPDIKGYLADKFAFTGTRPTLGNIDPCSDAEWEYVVSNWAKFSGWNPYTMGISSTITREEYRTIVSVVYGSEVPDWINEDYSFESVQKMLLSFKIPQRGNLSSYQTALAQEQKLFDTCSVHRKVPLKMFHATNDDVAPYRYSKYFYEMCKRGGSTVEFRTFASGGHNPTGETQNVTVGGVSITTNTLSLEVLDWLQRFE